MDEIRNNPEGLESGEARGIEQQSLDDATFEPAACVERSGGYQQAEAIQSTLMDVTENVSGAAGNEGSTAQPIPQPEDASLTGSQPKVRGDLDQATAGDSSEDKNQVTPINLPGPQVALEDPGTGPTPPDQRATRPDSPNDPAYYTPESFEKGAQRPGRTTAEPEESDGQGNFDIQMAQSEYNKSESMRSSVEKKKDQTDEDIIQKIG